MTHISVIYKYAGKDGTEPYNRFHGKNLIEKTLPAEDKKGGFDESTVTKTWLEAQRTETCSEADPNEKPPLSFIINLDDFVQAFVKTGSQKAIAYVVSASNDLITLNANESYWQKLWFRPRILRNVRTVHTKCRMLGLDVDMPVWICPMGVAKIAGQEGESALAAGAAKANIVHCISTVASLSLEEILASGKGHESFFQLYVDKQRHKTAALLKSLEGLPQIRALFVTVDLPVVSKREADERVRSQESAGAYGKDSKSGVDKKGGGLARTAGAFVDWSLSWDDLAWIKKHTSLPIVVKGIQSSADARTAMHAGCAGIVVSNHGGRALDNAPATILVLLELRRDCPEVFEKMEVFIDGGVRRGSDVLKAVMLGARGVGVGRPFQCSVAYGTEGVEHCAGSESPKTSTTCAALTKRTVLQDELETAMRLCGVTSLEAVRGDTSWLNMAELERLLPPKPNARSFWSSLFRARL